jgi:hypothetical protein
LLIQAGLRPASILNHKSIPRGIPSDSLSVDNALVPEKSEVETLPPGRWHPGVASVSLRQVANSRWVGGGTEHPTLCSEVNDEIGPLPDEDIDWELVLGSLLPKKYVDENSPTEVFGDNAPKRITIAVCKEDDLWSRRVVSGENPFAINFLNLRSPPAFAHHIG